MQVLHINANYISTKLHALLVSALDRLAENKVYAAVRKNQLCVYEKEEENVIKSVCITNLHRVFFHRKSCTMYKHLKLATDVGQYNIVHAHTLFTDGSVALKIKKEYGIPYVVTVRSTDINNFFKYRKNLKAEGIRILQNASRIVFLSAAYRDKLLYTYVPRRMWEDILKKTTIIPNGIDAYWHENKYAGKREEHDDLRLVSVGAINKNKNIVSVIEAAERLRKEGIKVHLDVAGRPENAAIIKEIEQAPHVTYHGLIGKEALLQIYRACDVFVLPSFHETFGLVYAEAMSQGLPVLYTENEGFDKQFPDGEVGYAVNPRSISDICEKITMVRADMEHLSQNAVDGIDKFNWEGIASRHKEMYDAVCMEEKGTA